MSVTITVNGVDQVVAHLAGITQNLQNISEGMLDAAGDTLNPAITDASVTVWGVRTGDYSGGWEMDDLGNGSIDIHNDVEYALPLETGWTTKNGGAEMSPGVAVPAVEDNLDAFCEALGQWLMEQ